MNDARNHITCEESHRLLDLHLGGELSADEERVFESHLNSCASCRELLASLESVRSVVRRAVGSQSVPTALADRVQNVPGAQQTGAPVIPIQDASNTSSQRIAAPQSGWWRYAAVAAIVLILLGGGYYFLAVRSTAPTIAAGTGDTAVTTPSVTPVEEQLTEVLRVGVNDHIHCAVTFHSSPDEHVTPEKIIGDMAEYAGLVPIVRENLEGYHVAVAHRCTIRGRKYVHMVLRKDTAMVSIAITRKKPGETFPHDAQALWTGNLNESVYQARVDDYMASGFETDEYLAYVVSGQPKEENLQIAAAIAAPVTEFLRTVKT